jgi:hypothetical protein
MVHEVLSKWKELTQYRLHLAWRLSENTKTPLLPVENGMKLQAPMKMKSGQKPPMYAVLHWTNFRAKIDQFSSYMKDECKETRIVAKGRCQGDKHYIVERDMKSLQEYGLPMYAKYTEDEKRTFYPSKSWILKDGDTKKKVKLCL